MLVWMKPDLGVDIVPPNGLNYQTSPKRTDIGRCIKKLMAPRYIMKLMAHQYVIKDLKR